jgi:23S rRNA pseudouridine2605 synthase
MRPIRPPRPTRPARPTGPASPSRSARPTRPARPTRTRVPQERAAEPIVSNKLQKVLAQAGLGSRRAMEELIRAGSVTVNGEPAQIGARVGPEDVVRVGRRIIRASTEHRRVRVLLYHKPEGEIVSRDDPQRRASAFDKLPAIRGGKWLSVGRLDFNTCGLLIFTTSGELVNRLSHPRFGVEREYAVRIVGQLDEEQARRLTAGISLADGDAKFESLADEGGEGSNHWYRVVVREGRNRIVRRMFEALGLTVSRLMRVRYGMVSLPSRVKRQQWLELRPEQVDEILNWCGMRGAAPADAEQRRLRPRGVVR